MSVNLVADARPGASVLLAGEPVKREGESGAVAPDPARSGAAILAVQEFGKGRTAVFTAEGSWKWAVGAGLATPAEKDASAQVYTRLWRQVVFWLARREERGGITINLTLPRHRVNVGDKVLMEARLLDPELKPLTDAAVTAEITSADGKKYERRFWIEGDGYRVDFEPPAPGDYKVRVAAVRGGAEAASRETAFVAAGMDAEFLTLVSRPSVLEALARSSGGRHAGADGAAEVFADIHKRAAGRALRQAPAHGNLVFLLVRRDYPSPPAPGMGAPETLGSHMTKQPSSPPSAALRRRVARAAAILESAYGAPSYSERHVLDSLIGCILSQNTNDLNSGRAWRMLRRRFPTWSKAAKAPVEAIEDAIRIGGLSHCKALRIKAILADLKASRNRYDLDFLRDMSEDDAFDYLTAMSGVGKKTAAVVLLFAAQRDIFPVDTHIHRIAQRLGWVREGASRDEVFETMRRLVPKGKAMSFHINLLRFGRERCSKRSPNHLGCPLRRQCLYVRGLVAF